MKRAVWVLLWVWSASASAKELIPPLARATPKISAISLDGYLNEESWEQAPIFSGFIQREPFVGEPATEKTEFQLLFDQEAFYIAVHAYDSEPEKITARTRRFDSGRLFSDDFIAIKIDSAHDHRTVYYFAVTPRGAAYDAIVLDNGAQFLSEWDAAWDVGVRIDSSGWVAEFRIPFSSFSYDPDNGPLFGLNITRRISRKTEEFDWAEIPPPFGGLQTNYFGHVERIPLPQKPKRNITFTPSLSAGYRETESNADSFTDLGLDIKIPLSRNAVVKGTYNTDFSQVDIDQSQLNFNRFDLFYPEKRRFFLEGTQFFDFGAQGNNQLFFSRRVGLENGSPIPILGGIRSYGTVGSNEFGVLNIQTEAKDEVPDRNFTVGRLRRRLGEQTNVGGMVTYRQNTSGSPEKNIGAGVDLTYLSQDGRLKIAPFLAFSRSDAHNPNENAQTGASAFLHVLWTPPLWKLAHTSMYVSEDFNPEVGFIKRKDILQETFNLQRSIRLPEKGIDEILLFANNTFFLNGSANRLLDASGEEGIQVNTNSGYTASIRGLHSTDEVLEPFELQNRVTIPQGRYSERGVQVSASSPDYQNIQAGLTLRQMGFFGGRRQTISPSVTVRPKTGLYLNASASFNMIDLPHLDTHYSSSVINGAASYSLNTKMYIDLNASWNEVNGKVVVQYRYRWRFAPMSDLFLVHSEERDDQDFSAQTRSMVVKIVAPFH